MKNVEQLPNDINKLYDKLIANLMKAQHESAEKIWNRVVEIAPVDTGGYIASIQVGETKYEAGEITTKVFTDMKTEDGYFLGRMLENGTGIYALEPHIGHTQTFIESGYRYWYIPADKVDRPIGRLITIKGNEYYVGHAQPAKPHFKPALDENREAYKQAIRKAVLDTMREAL